MGGERRGVAVVGTIEPKPVAPPPKDDAPVVIVVASHGVALPELPVVVIVKRKSHTVSPDNVDRVVMLTIVMTGPRAMGVSCTQWGFLYLPTTAATP